MQELIGQYVELRNLPDWTSNWGIYNGDIFKILQLDELDHVTIQVDDTILQVHPGCYTLIGEPVAINELLELL